MPTETLQATPIKAKRVSLKQPKQYKLIDGTFTPKQGKEVLTNLFSSKIQFNKAKSFSAWERTGKYDPQAEKRVKELKQSLAKIQEAIEAAEKRGKILKIESQVVIHFIEA